MDLLEMNPFTKIGKEWALVSAGNKNKCNTMTVSWGGVGVLWGKNVVYIFIRDCPPSSVKTVTAVLSVR